MSCISIIFSGRYSTPRYIIALVSTSPSAEILDSNRSTFSEQFRFALIRQPGHNMGTRARGRVHDDLWPSRRWHTVCKCMQSIPSARTIRWANAELWMQFRFYFSAQVDAYAVCRWQNGIRNRATAILFFLLFNLLQLLPSHRIWSNRKLFLFSVNEISSTDNCCICGVCASTICMPSSWRTVTSRQTSSLALEPNNASHWLLESQHRSAVALLRAEYKLIELNQ